MNELPPISADALLEHQAFLRALARGLLFDADAAEDVVQETWLVALTRAPAAPHALRAWLARVAHNAALNLRRGEGRRAARERGCARPEAVPHEAEVEERLAEQARVAEAVLRLREPYRTTIYLRFAEDLPPREIARRLGVPVETVRSHQKRGLAELRRRLEHELGGGSALVIALRRVARVHATASGSLVPAVAAVALITGAVLSIVLAMPKDSRLAAEPGPIEREQAANSALASTRSDPGSPYRRSLTGSRELDPRSTIALEHGSPRSESIRARPESRADLVYAVTIEGAGGADLRDFVVTLDVGSAVLVGGLEPGDPVRARFTGLPAPSLVGRAERAEYELGLESRDGLSGARARVHAIDPGAHPIALRLGPQAALTGSVRDASGAPVASAIVTVELESGRRRETSSDDAGRFRIGALPAGTAKLSARARFRASAPVVVPLVTGEVCEQEVRLDGAPSSTLRGRLESRGGRSLSSSELRLRSREDPEREVVAVARTTQGGTCSFEFEDVPAGEYELFAPADGFAWEPARLVVTAPGGDVRLLRRDEVPARKVAFRARSAEDGTPIDRLRVAWIVDPVRRGKRPALVEQGGPRITEVESDENALELAAGADLHWVVEHEGCLSVFGDASTLAREGERLVAEVRLEPSWRVMLELLDERGRPLGIEGARLATSGGRELATSFADGRIQLELAHDPGRLALELEGWRVIEWEGFRRGKRRSELPVHRVWMQRE